MKYPFITVIGNVGSGKTTFSKWLAGQLSGTFVPADELYKTNPFFSDALTDRKRWSCTSDIWFLLKRVELVRDIVGVAQTSPVVQDSGIPMSWVYASSRLSQGYMSPAEFTLYTEIFQKLNERTIQEDLVIYLDFPVPTLLERIKERGREFEIKHHSADYLHSLQLSLEAYVEHQRELGKKVLQFSQAEMNGFLEDSEFQKNIISKITKELH